jgi:hypothetical protein
MEINNKCAVHTWTIPVTPQKPFAFKTAAVFLEIKQHNLEMSHQYAACRNGKQAYSIQAKTRFDEVAIHISFLYMISRSRISWQEY